MTSPQRRQKRALRPSRRKRKPTRVGLLQLLQTSMTLDTWSGASRSMMPAWVASARGFMWRFTMLTPCDDEAPFAGEHLAHRPLSCRGPCR